MRTLIKQPIPDRPNPIAPMEADLSFVDDPLARAEDRLDRNSSVIAAILGLTIAVQTKDAALLATDLPRAGYHRA